MKIKKCCTNNRSLMLSVVTGLTPVVRMGQISLIISRVCSQLWRAGGGPSQHSRYSDVSTQPPNPTFNLPPQTSCCSASQCVPSCFHLLCSSILIHCSVTDHARHSLLTWGFCFQSDRRCLADHLKELLCMRGYGGYRWYCSLIFNIANI